MVRDVLVGGSLGVGGRARGGRRMGPRARSDGPFEWTSGSAVLRVPVGSDGPPASVGVVLQAERRKEVRLDGGAGTLLVDVDRRPVTVEVEVGAQTLRRR